MLAETGEDYGTDCESNGAGAFLPIEREDQGETGEGEAEAEGREAEGRKAEGREVKGRKVEGRVN